MPIETIGDRVSPAPTPAADRPVADHLPADSVRVEEPMSVASLPNRELVPVPETETPGE